MTTREFIQHLLLNAELEDPVEIEVKIPENKMGYVTFEPEHVSRIGKEDDPITLVECKPYKGE